MIRLYKRDTIELFVNEWKHKRDGEKEEEIGEEMKIEERAIEMEVDE